MTSTEMTGHGRGSATKVYKYGTLSLLYFVQVNLVLEMKLHIALIPHDTRVLHTDSKQDVFLLSSDNLDCHSQASEP